VGQPNIAAALGFFCFFLPPVRNWKKGACAKWGQSNCNFSGWGRFLQSFIS
jgi:hypothetical protein